MATHAATETTRTDADLLADFISTSTGMWIHPRQITICADGYAVSGLRREAALLIGRAVFGAFASDESAGLPTVRIAAGWRHTPEHTVRVSIDKAGR